jgi:hypothetical protein
LILGIDISYFSFVIRKYLEFRGGENSDPEEHEAVDRSNL